MVWSGLVWEGEEERKGKSGQAREEGPKNLSKFTTYLPRVHSMYGSTCTYLVKAP